MSYSCTDFVDSVLDALHIDLPEEAWDDPSAQADLTLAEIERLQRFEKGVKHALAVWQDTKDASRLVARLTVLANEKAREA